MTKQRLTLNLARGVDLLYSFEMSSQALFDMSIALQQQDGNADASRAPKMNVRTEIKGTIELVPLGSANHRIQVLCTLRPREVYLQQNGREITDPLPQLNRQLTLPFLAEYTEQGQIASVRFDPNCEATARGFACGLLAYLQVTLPEKATQSIWQAREAEPNGIFIAKYARRTGTVDTMTVSKTKSAPATMVTSSGTEQLHSSQTVTPEGALHIVFDTRHGLIREVCGDESFATALGAAPVARSRNTISLELRSYSLLTAARRRSLQELAQERLRHGPGYSLARMVETTPAQEAQIQRANLGNATVEQVLVRVKALDQSVDPEAEARELLPRLKACIYLYPQICIALQAQFQSARPDKIGVALIVEALRAAGHPVAQRSLITLLKARHRERSLAVLLIPALAQLQNPIPQVDKTLLEIALNKGDTFIISTAWLALGALDHTLALSVPARAHRITLILQHQLQRAKTISQKQSLLLALANAAQITTLPTLIQQARDRSPEVRGAALLALARLPGTQPERLVCEALSSEHNAHVRMAAAMAAEGKINSAAVRRSLLQTLEHDRDAQVRVKALYALWGGARQRPEVVAGLKATAQHDASEDVQQIARRLLAENRQ